MEQWKPVVGFEGYYEVSDAGRVRSLVGRWGKGRMLKLRPSNYGYHMVDLRAPGRKKMAQVGVMVAQAFHGPRPEGKETCHNNGIRTDNRLCNLRYDTRKGNHADAFLHGTRLFCERHPNAKLTNQIVRAILRDERTFTAIANQYRVSITQISNIKHRRHWRRLD